MPTSGPWNQLGARVKVTQAEIVKRAEKAMEAAAVVLVGEIRAGIAAQAPGGQRFKPLSEMTIWLRLERMDPAAAAKVMKRARKISAAGGTAHKRLMDHGGLLRAITCGWSSDRKFIRVGVSKLARTDQGVEYEYIARIQTEGRVIRVTPKMRAYLAHRGEPLPWDKTHIIIPPSPFIEPTYKAVRPKLQAVVRGVFVLDRAPVRAWTSE